MKMPNWYEKMKTEIENGWLLNVFDFDPDSTEMTFDDRWVYEANLWYTLFYLIKG